VLGNVWWAFKPDGLNAEQEKALLLWLNSSLSILLCFGRRVVTQGAWTQMKQPAWQSVPVLDVRALSSEKLKELAATYDYCSVQELKALSQLKTDDVRCEIDLAIRAALDISELTFVRDLLDREPGMTAAGIAARTNIPEIAYEDEEEAVEAELF